MPYLTIQSAPNQYTQIAFPVKALKLLLKDVQNIGKGKGVANRQDDEIDSDDGVSWLSSFRAQ